MFKDLVSLKEDISLAPLCSRQPVDEEILDT